MQRRIFKTRQAQRRSESQTDQAETVDYSRWTEVSDDAAQTVEAVEATLSAYAASKSFRRF